MSIEINELFEMLSWDSNEETQQKGIEEGKKIKYLSILIQPVEDKGVWENCAKIIAQKSDEVLEPYIFLLLEWLQDSNWPGFSIIFDRIKAIPVKLIKTDYSYTIKKAYKQEDEMWLYYLSKLAENVELYETLQQEVKEIIKKYYMLDSID